MFICIYYMYFPPYEYIHKYILNIPKFFFKVSKRKPRRSV